MLEFKAMARLKGVQSALNSNFDKDHHQITDKRFMKLVESNWIQMKKYKQALEANKNAMHLSVLSVKRVTCRNMFKKREAG